MITKNNLKYFSSLKQKKVRTNENKFIVEGVNSVSEGLKSNFSCAALIFTEEFALNNPLFAEEISTSEFTHYKIKKSEFEKISDTKTPQGIAAVFNIPERKKLSIIKDEVVVFLDNINDPGNLGTIIRTCDWFGIKSILLSKDCTEYTNPKVVRSSAGSIFHLNIFDDYALDDLKMFKSNGYEIYCTDITGENINEIQKPEKLVIIFSNEAHGPSREILETSDKKVSIPKIGNAESLNVAAACGIILFQLTK